MNDLQRRILLKSEISELELGKQIVDTLSKYGITQVDHLLRLRINDFVDIQGLELDDAIQILCRIQEIGLGFDRCKDAGEEKLNNSQMLKDCENSQEDADAMKRVPGKEKCSELREIRKTIADANGIEFNTTECRHADPCAGTCPVCDAELEYLDKELQNIREKGGNVVLPGIAQGVLDKYTTPNNRIRSSGEKEYDIDAMMAGSISMGSESLPSADLQIGKISEQKEIGDGFMNIPDTMGVDTPYDWG